MRLCIPSILIAFTPLATAQKLSVTELIETHRQTICSVSCEDWRRIDGIGPSQLKAVTGTTGIASGRMRLTIGPARFDLDFRVPRADFPGERFSYDGENVHVEFISPGIRSPYGNFVYVRSIIIREGLMGGSLNPNWPLFDHERKRNIRYRGWKKKRKLHKISYQASRLTSLAIRIYLDQEWKHVKTTYTITFNRGINAPLDIRRAPTPWMENKQAIREELIETFGEFRSVDGFLLPTLWGLEYRRQGAGQGQVWQWATRFSTLKPGSLEEH
jgi:hypothetical protein